MSTQVGGKARFNGALQEFGYGAIKFDPTLDELRGHDDYSGISPRVKNAGCPDIAEALVAVAAARDVPDAVLQSAKIAIPVYLPGAGDYKGQHRDSAAAFLIKYDSHYYPYVCRLLNGAEERFGLTFDNSRDGETIQIKGKNVAIWSSHTANTVQYHEVKSSKDSNASPSATIAFFLPKTDENAVSDPTITRTLLPIEGWARLRPSLRRVGQLTREHFTVGGTSAKPVQRVEPTPTPTPEADHEDYAARMAEFQRLGQRPKSKFKMVYYHKGTRSSSPDLWNSYVSSVKSSRKKSFPFDAEGELAAALRSDQICRDNERPVHNFPRDGDLGAEPPASRYYGVTKITRNADVRWQARITYSNWKNDIYIGCFDEEQEAARAVDEYLASIGYERRNFPEDEVEDLEDLGGDAVSSPQ